ncbi:Spo0B domain-containing protein [Rummeliibacillus suwonensis]|uniref:Spo0B domain-containing protein n=1 Tax=Rummeliibacillus suwonensis TaxID=1306154 RepID=UPI001AAF3476|nr:Spo0B domain-containing protein [Rummeliibacillus suwonensis]MBO2534826.1 Spo0B domain-containing protein [Rummeliibacillus suwonensis]
MMNGNTLTINEALRFANHDFLNQLQLIKINLDLGRTDSAKTAVEEITEQCKTFFNINRLGLPKTIEWIHTLGWRYQNFHVDIQSMIEHEVNPILDDAICNYLEESVLHVYSSLDPFIDQQLSLQIYSTARKFEILFHAKGRWEQKDVFQQSIQQPLLVVEDDQFSEQEWQYVILNNKEGL